MSKRTSRGTVAGTAAGANQTRTAVDRGSPATRAAPTRSTPSRATPTRSTPSRATPTRSTPSRHSNGTHRSPPRPLTHSEMAQKNYSSESSDAESAESAETDVTDYPETAPVNWQPLRRVIRIFENAQITSGVLQDGKYNEALKPLTYYNPVAGDPTAAKKYITYARRLEDFFEILEVIMDKVRDEEGEAYKDLDRPFEPDLEPDGTLGPMPYVFDSENDS